MVLIPIALASITLTVWINEIPDWQKGGALAQLQFEDWYLQSLYPDDEIGLPPELATAPEIAKLPGLEGAPGAFRME